MLRAFVTLGINVSNSFQTFRWPDLGLTTVTVEMFFKSGAPLQSTVLHIKIDPLSLYLVNLRETNYEIKDAVLF